MNRKDIALTVAGVLATMALAYLFYRQQQAASQTAAVTTSQDVTSPGYSTDQGLYDSSLEYQYASQMPSISVPTVSSTSSTSSYANSVDTSASTAATGGEASTDYTNLLSQIISTYALQNAPASPAFNQTDFSGLVIPTVDTQPVVSTTGIPTTAGDALTDAQNMLGVGGGLITSAGAAVPPPSTQAPSTSAQPVTQTSPLHYNHIVSTAPGTVGGAS